MRAMWVALMVAALVPLVEAQNSVAPCAYNQPRGLSSDDLTYMPASARIPAVAENNLLRAINQQLSWTQTSVWTTSSTLTLDINVQTSINESVPLCQVYIKKWYYSRFQVEVYTVGNELEEWVSQGRLSFMSINPANANQTLNLSACARFVRLRFSNASCGSLCGQDEWSVRAVNFRACTAPPSAVPTTSPTSGPSPAPTTVAPTARPTPSPTSRPSSAPTVIPSASPTSPPTQSPTSPPTQAPSVAPTYRPTVSIDNARVSMIDSDSDGSKGRSRAGIVVGAILGTLLTIGGVIFFAFRYSRRNLRQTEIPRKSNEDPNTFMFMNTMGKIIDGAQTDSMTEIKVGTQPHLRNNEHTYEEPVAESSYYASKNGDDGSEEDLVNYSEAVDAIPRHEPPLILPPNEYEIPITHNPNYAPAGQRDCIVDEGVPPLPPKLSVAQGELVEDIPIVGSSCAPAGAPVFMVRSKSGRKNFAVPFANETAEVSIGNTHESHYDCAPSFAEEMTSESDGRVEDPDFNYTVPVWINSSKESRSTTEA